jgi:hypothetical protein
MKRVIWLAPALLLAGCPEKSPPTPPPPAPYAKATPAVQVAAPRVRFTDVGEKWGIAFRHDNGRTDEKLMPETMSGGVAIADIDGDGKPDLLFTNGRRIDRDAQPSDPPPVTAYRNLGGGRFEDVTERWGFKGLPRRHAMGLAIAHALSKDGPPEILVTAFDGALFLRWEKDHYVDRTKEAGLAPPMWKDAKGNEHPAWSTAAAFFDADGDGKLDLFVGHYIQWTREQDILATVDGKTKIYATPELYKGQSPRLYRNKGDGTFEDATEKLGLLNPKGKALGVALGDLAGDGRFAIAVANDTEPNNLFVWKDGKYVDEGLSRGIAFDEQGKPRAGMGVDLVSEGASWTLAVGNFSKESTALYRGVEKLGIDRAAAAGIAAPTRSLLSFGLAFADLSADGELDLVIANGHIEPSIQQVQKEIAYAEPPCFFRATGDGKFEDATQASGLAKPLVGRGLALGDLDGDGFLDLVIAQNGGPPLVARSEVPANARTLRLVLHARGDDPDAIGARATVKVGERARTASVRTGGSYLSQHELALTFGLGAATRADKVTVRWPDGKTQDLGALEAGTHEVREAD